MPAIRLSDIPNAPGAGAPNLEQGGAPLPNVPRGAFLDASSISRGAANLREAPVNADAMNAGVLAMSNFGKAVREAAGVPADLSLRLQKAQNVADIARADVIMRDAWGAHQDKIQSLPQDQWEETWKTQGLASAREQIAKLGLSQAALDQLTPDFTNWEGATTTQIRTQAVKQTIQGNRMALDTATERAILTKDLPAAFAHVSAGESSGLYSPEEADKKRLEVERVVIAEAKDQRKQEAMRLVSANPEGMVEVLKQAMDSGEAPKVKGLEWAKPEDVADLHTKARTAVNRNEVDLFNNLRDAAASGNISVETLRAAAAPLGAEKVQTIVDLRMADPAYDPKAVVEVMGKIDSYDVKNDSDLSKLKEINEGIAKVPKALQGKLSQRLSDVEAEVDKPPRQKCLADLKKETIDWAKTGNLGPTGRDPKNEKVILDKPASDALYVKIQTGLELLDDYAKKTPNAGPQELLNERNRIFAIPATDATSKGYEAKPLNEAKYFGIPAYQGKTAAWTGMQPIRVQATNFSLGQSVGGADETEDPNTNAGHAATGHGLLTPGVASVDPSVYPYGTIFVDEKGFAHIAMDKHGNRDHGVVDFYQSPGSYQKKKEARNLRIVGKSLYIPRSVHEVRVVLGQYGKIPPGESAVESLAAINARRNRK
ncbi:MAG: hypothetical protein WCQ16_02805 [Verrucomicrobiae bacterium]